MPATRCCSAAQISRLTSWRLLAHTENFHRQIFYDVLLLLIAGQVDKSKMNMLLINKADLLGPELRKQVGASTGEKEKKRMKRIER